jgi:muramoyltetrapeptide carboxypeptidase
LFVWRCRINNLNNNYAFENLAVVIDYLLICFDFETIKLQKMFRIYLLLFFLVSQLQAQTTMIIPPNLQKGDTIAIVATARKNIVDNLKPAIDLAKSWGLNVVIGNTIGLDNHQLAGTDEQRAADFQEMIDNPTIKAVWCVRGGYGTARMVELVDFSKFKNNPKWIIGFNRDWQNT